MLFSSWVFYHFADVNECDSSLLHQCAELCTNTIGSYTCSCNDDGYELHDDEMTCIGKCKIAIQ